MGLLAGQYFALQDCWPKFQKILRMALTFFSFLVNFITILQILSGSEWLPKSAEDIALLCFYTSDLVLNISLGTYMCCCQTAMLVGTW